MNQDWLTEGMREVDAAETLDEACDLARCLVISATTRMVDRLESHLIFNPVGGPDGHPLVEAVRAYKEARIKLDDVYADMRQRPASAVVETPAEEATTASVGEPLVYAAPNGPTHCAKCFGPFTAARPAILVGDEACGYWKPRFVVHRECLTITGNSGPRVPEGGGTEPDAPVDLSDLTIVAAGLHRHSLERPREGRDIYERRSQLVLAAVAELSRLRAEIDARSEDTTRIDARFISKIRRALNELNADRRALPPHDGPRLIQSAPIREAGE